ncbi:EGF-like domain protein [Trichuris suis]|nr:EGF-like domain protein [Trichuris suis]
MLQKRHRKKSMPRRKSLRSPHSPRSSDGQSKSATRSKPAEEERKKAAKHDYVLPVFSVESVAHTYSGKATVTVSECKEVMMIVADGISKKLRRPPSICLSKPCKNGGACSSDGDRYLCNCMPGFKGFQCEETYETCDKGQKCENGGKCTKSQETYACNCTSNYTGVHCEYEVQYCENDTCLPNGKCQNVTTLRTYRCHCGKSHTGRRCEYAVEYCKPESCSGHGICYNLSPGNIKCLCYIGYGGPFCGLNLYVLGAPFCLCAVFLIALLLLRRCRKAALILKTWASHWNAHCRTMGSASILTFQWPHAREAEIEVMKLADLLFISIYNALILDYGSALECPATWGPHGWTTLKYLTSCVTLVPLSKVAHCEPETASNSFLHGQKYLTECIDKYCDDNFPAGYFWTWIPNEAEETTALSSTSVDWKGVLHGANYISFQTCDKGQKCENGGECMKSQESYTFANVSRPTQESTANMNLSIVKAIIARRMVNVRTSLPSARLGATATRPTQVAVASMVTVAYCKPNSCGGHVICQNLTSGKTKCVCYTGYAGEFCHFSLYATVLPGCIGAAVLGALLILRKRRRKDGAATKSAMTRRRSTLLSLSFNVPAKLTAASKTPQERKKKPTGADYVLPVFNASSSTRTSSGKAKVMKATELLFLSICNALMLRYARPLDCLEKWVPLRAIEHCAQHTPTQQFLVGQKYWIECIDKYCHDEFPAGYFWTWMPDYAEERAEIPFIPRDWSEVLHGAALICSRSTNNNTNNDPCFVERSNRSLTLQGSNPYTYASCYGVRRFDNPNHRYLYYRRSCSGFRSSFFRSDVGKHYVCLVLRKKFRYLYFAEANYCDALSHKFLTCAHEGRIPCARNRTFGCNFNKELKHCVSYYYPDVSRHRKQYEWCQFDYGPRCNCSCSNSYSQWTSWSAYRTCDKGQKCENSGVCTKSRDSYVCQCMSGYTGVHCEYKAELCEADTCTRNGDCQNVTAFSTFRCHCRLPYSGRRCEYGSSVVFLMLHEFCDMLLTAYQYCKADSCHRHGVCQNLTLGKIRCVCRTGYAGEFCDVRVYLVILPICICAAILGGLLILLKHRGKSDATSSNTVTRRRTTLLSFSSNATAELTAASKQPQQRRRKPTAAQYVLPVFKATSSARASSAKATVSCYVKPVFVCRFCAFLLGCRTGAFNETETKLVMKRRDVLLISICTALTFHYGRPSECEMTWEPYGWATIKYLTSCVTFVPIRQIDHCAQEASKQQSIYGQKYTVECIDKYCDDNFPAGYFWSWIPDLLQEEHILDAIQFEWRETLHGAAFICNSSARDPTSHILCVTERSNRSVTIQGSDLRTYDSCTVYLPGSSDHRHNYNYYRRRCGGFYAPFFRTGVDKHYVCLTLDEHKSHLYFTGAGYCSALSYKFLTCGHEGVFPCDRNRTLGQKCKNSGVCTKSRDSYVCQCMSGYTGVHCEYEVGHCEANSCWRNGDCQNVTAFSTFRCHCRWPYSGRHCEYGLSVVVLVFLEFCDMLLTAYQYCKADSCHGHGVCQNLTTGKIRCVCHGGYGGEFCDASVYPIVLPVCMCASVLAALLIVLKYRRRRGATTRRTVTRKRSRHSHHAHKVHAKRSNHLKAPEQAFEKPAKHDYVLPVFSVDSTSHSSVGMSTLVKSTMKR